MRETITYDCIWDCWKKKEYPDNYDELLEQYIETKIKLIGSLKQRVKVTQELLEKDFKRYKLIKKPETSVEYINRWLPKLLIAIEIGILRNKNKFKKYKEYIEISFGLNFDISIEKEQITIKV